jgi:hypothetical protein
MAATYLVINVPNGGEDDGTNHLQTCSLKLKIMHTTLKNCDK